MHFNISQRTSGKSMYKPRWTYETDPQCCFQLSIEISSFPHCSTLIFWSYQMNMHCNWDLMLINPTLHRLKVQKEFHDMSFISTLHFLLCHVILKKKWFVNHSVDKVKKLWFYRTLIKKTFLQVLNLNLFLNLRYSSKYFAQIYRAQYAAANKTTGK